MYPKQFIRFRDDQAQSFLAGTLQRLDCEDGFAPPIIVCNADHRFLVEDEAARAGVKPAAIVLEPVARNTAAAVAIAALLVERADAAGILAVMPSDHVIKDEAAFVAAVRRAAAVAETGRLVLFGIAPTGPHTGYGYIRRGAPLAGPAPRRTSASCASSPRRSRRHRPSPSTSP
jgi:mannose-1-phosphate guanylyltransferase/mannose-6-phosphate isomerase